MCFPRSRVVSLCSVALCVLTCVVAEGRRVKVRHAPVVAEAEPAFADIPRQVTDADTLTMIRIFGYDKPLSSDRESMFLTSEIDSDTICGIEEYVCIPVLLSFHAKYLEARHAAWFLRVGTRRIHFIISAHRLAPVNK